jgi:cytochrome c biogenesis protein CcdA/thiol-disulfide isomerase/thioredoxin
VIEPLLAALAGIATVASPCILPMLPLLLGVSVGHTDRWRPLFIVLGFALSFCAMALAFGATAQALGLSQDAVRALAIATLLLLGTVMLFPALSDRLTARLGGLADIADGLGRRTGAGRLGGFGLGLTLGALWTPCAGPVLASALALVATATDPTRATGLLAAYAAGAGLPMLAIAYGGQIASVRLRGLLRHATRLRQAFGAAIIATAVAMQGQYDVQAAAWLAQWVPTASATAAPAAPPADTAPEFAGITQWLNSPPLSMASLRGKVVLVDFWTYGCVNCVRTVPQVAQWHERYKDQGLVVVGVHTPEYGFERSTGNVRAALQRLGIRYPVAQDNGYQTWNAWHNRYWPAQYLVDREGRVVMRHVGEGDEPAIEQAIRSALKSP